jgi:hypothetical protein
MREVCVQPVKDRFAQARRDAGRDDGHPGTDGIPIAAQLVDQRFQFGDAGRIRAEERIAVDLSKVARLDADRADLGEIAGMRMPRRSARYFRAIAPAATRITVSRADDQPPPIIAKPYFCWYV